MADTKISNLTAASTLAGTEEIPLSDGTTTTKACTATQIKTFVTNAPTLTAPVFAAGTATAGTHPVLTTGTLLSAAAAGAVEYVAPLLYATGDTTAGRGLVPAEQILFLNADYTGSAASGVQACFPAATDRITVAGNTTYLFDLFLSVTNGTTTATKALAFNGGTCTFTAIRYFGIGQNVAVNSTGTTQSTIHVDTAASTVVLATGTASWWIYAKGSMGINASGTLLPQFSFSANPTGTVLVKRGSYIRLRAIGNSTSDLAIGTWA